MARRSAVKHCRYCHSEMKVSDASYEENPWCSGCLHERIAKAAAEDPLVAEVWDGDYVTFIRKSDLG
jgi:hypothetical protein